VGVVDQRQKRRNESVGGFRRRKKNNPAPTRIIANVLGSQTRKETFARIGEEGRRTGCRKGDRKQTQLTNRRGEGNLLETLAKRGLLSRKKVKSSKPLRRQAKSGRRNRKDRLAAKRGPAN